MKTREMKKLLNSQNQILANFSKNIDSKFEKLNISLNSIKSLLVNQNTNSTNQSSNNIENSYFFIPKNEKKDLKNGKGVRFYYLNDGQLMRTSKINPFNFKACERYLVPFTMCSKMQSLIDQSPYGEYIYGDYEKIKTLFVHKKLNGKCIILNSKNNNAYSLLYNKHKINVYNQVSPIQKAINPKFHIRNKSLVQKLLKSIPKLQDKGLSLCSVNKFIKKAGLDINSILTANVATDLKPTYTFSFHSPLTNRDKKVLLTTINNIKLISHSNHDVHDKELELLNSIAKFAPSLKFYKSLKNLINNSDNTQVNNYFKVWAQYCHINYNKLAKFHVKYLLKQLMLGTINKNLWKVNYVIHRLSLYVPMNNKFIWGNLIQKLGMYDNSAQKVESIIAKMFGIIHDNGYTYSKEIQDVKNKRLQKFEQNTSYIVFTKSSYQNYIHDDANSFDVVTLNGNHLRTYHNVLESDLTNNKLKTSFANARKIESLSSKLSLTIKLMQFSNVFPRLDCAGNTDVTSKDTSSNNTINSIDDSNSNNIKVDRLCKKALSDISNSYKFAIDNKSENGASLSKNLGSKLFKSKLINDVVALKPSLSKFGWYDNLLNEISNENDMKHLYSVVVSYINKLLSNYHINNADAFSINSSDVKSPENQVIHQHDLKFSVNPHKLNALVKQINNRLDNKSDLDDIKLIRDIEKLQPYLSNNQFSKIWNDFSNSTLTSDILNNIINA